MLPGFTWTDIVLLLSPPEYILDTLGTRQIPDAGDFPRWPMLRLNTERIFDAIRNGDLPYGKAGITCDDPSLFDDPDLTVRHVDLM